MIIPIKIFSHYLRVEPRANLHLKKVLRRNIFRIHLDKSTRPLSGIFRYESLIDNQVIDHIRRDQIERKCLAIRLCARQQNTIDHGLVIPIGQPTNNNEFSFLQTGAGGTL